MKTLFMPNPRMREARQSAKMSLATLSELCGISISQISKIETGNRQPSQTDMVKIARALNCQAIEIFSQIGEIQTKRRMIPVVGYVGAGDEIIAIDDHPKGGGLDEVEPLYDGMPQSTVGVIVRGDSMIPVYNDGDILFYDEKIVGDVSSFANKECIVSLVDGRKFIKKIQRLKGGGWLLLSHNAPAIDDVEIEWAARIKWVKKR